MKKLFFFVLIFCSNVFAQDLNSNEYQYAKKLYLAEQYTRAVFQFDTLLSKSGEDDRLLAGLSASLWMLGDTKAAIDNLALIKNRSFAREVSKSLMINGGDLSLLTSSNNDQSYLNEFRKLDEDKIKSPGTAAIMSALIPGSGHLYLGAYQSAAVVFFFNALTGISTIEFANKHLTAPAITSGILFSMFYVGGIYSSYDGALKMNQMKNSKSKKDLNYRYFPLLKLEF